MDPVVLILVTAGAVVAGFLFLAALLWGIRSRRGEEIFTPAPDAMRKSRAPSSTPGPESVPDWLRAPEETESRPASTFPEWLQGTTDIKSAAGTVGEIGKIPEREPDSLLTSLLRGAVPQLSTIMALGKMVQQMEAQEGTRSKEERAAILGMALDRMLEEHPGDEFLQQMRKTILLSGDGTSGDAGIQIIQVNGRNVFRIDDVEYYSLEDIPDPQRRDAARRKLLSGGE